MNKLSILSAVLCLFGSSYHVADAAGHEGAVPTTTMEMEIATTPVEYLDGNSTLLGHLALPEDAMTAPKPAIIIIPDWDGVNEYEQMRATMIAQEWGMVGFAADIYGSDLQFVESFQERGQLATFYRSNPDIFGARIQSAIDLVKSMPEVDSDNVALFGYCFGGTGVLQYGLYGNNDVNAIASFHGGLVFLPEEPLEFGPKLLVISGGEDDASSDVMDLEIMLDQANASWEITRYSDVVHGFTDFTNLSVYNKWVDDRSWQASYDFVLEVFGVAEFMSAQPDQVSTIEVDYVDPMDGTPLKGHVAIPSEQWARPLPAIVIFPDWDGAGDGYEMERATALAELGYVAMVADIYGADKQFVESREERGALVGQYASNPELYMSRMQTAIDQAKGLLDVDEEQIGVIGYCFGGSGVILYSFFSGADAKVAVAFHGSFSELPPVMVEDISPYLLVLSGGDDGLHGNQTIMEDAFDSGNALWEITRYSGVGHGFTVFGGGAYNLVADARSWESMLLSFKELLAVPQKETMDGNDEGSSTDAPTVSPNTDAGRSITGNAASVVLSTIAVVLAAFL